MSVFVNHINLGKNYEALFVCPEIFKNYFFEVAAFLETDMAVKSDVFCYDSEKLSLKIREKLRKSKNVIFVLTSGVTERAAADENDAFRQTYGYVWKTNPNSISLMAVNNCFISYDINYPEDMQSFQWLHRKSYNLGDISCENLAANLYSEFRRDFAPGENRRIEKLAEHGVSRYFQIYNKSSRSAKNTLLYSGIALLAAIFVMLDPIKNMPDGFLVLFGFLSALLCSVAIGFLCFGIMYDIYARLELANVSILFSDFIRRSLQRIAALLGIGLWGAICYGAFQLINAADKKEIDIRISIIYGFAILVSVAIVWIINASSLIYAAGTSSYYIELCEKRPKIRITYVIVYGVLFTTFAIAGFVIYTVI